MADTAFKSKGLVGLAPPTPAIGGLAPNTRCKWTPFGALLRQQDAVPATSRRIVGEWSLSGADDWAQPDGSVDPDAGGASPQVYPTNDWRTLATNLAHVTPGCELRCHVIYCPAGLVHKGGGPWANDGAWAEFRVLATWTNGGNTDGPNEHGLTMEGSPLGTYTGAELTADAANWGALREREIAGIRPVDYNTDPQVAADFSEWSDVELELQVRGGARVVGVTVYEYPLAHVTENDDAGLTSVHAMPPGLNPLTPRPMTKAVDGVTYEEHRFGNVRMMQVAERQSERLGPRVLHVNSWNEDTIDVLTDVEADAITTTSATFVELFDSAITSYAVTNPGWVVAGAHAQLHRISGSELISRGEFAVVPCRVRVDASRTSGTGTVRVHCGSYEWVDVSITAGRAVYTQTGFLQSQVNADNAAPPLAIFIRTTAGTLSIWNISIDFNTWA